MRFRPLAGVYAALAFVALSFVPVSAAAEGWKLDKDHVHVTFTAQNLGFSITQGQFRKFDAEIDMDPDNIESAEVAFTIDATSVDTNSKSRDRHLRSKQFLDVKTHPEITFASRSVRLITPDTATITGDLTLKGETREETFEARLMRMAPSPFDANQIIAGFVVTGEIDRLDYDVSYGAPAIGVKVPIRIDIQMTKDK